MEIKRLRAVMLVLALLLVGATAVAAPNQGKDDQGKAGKKNRPAPSLSTEDIVPVPNQLKAEPASGEAQAADAKDGAAEAKAEAKSPAEGPEAKAAEGKGEPEKTDPEELEWRERMRQAREMVRQLRQQTQETELGLTELRNNRYRGNQTASSLNASAEAIEQNGRDLSALRQELAAAVSEMEAVAEEGKEKKYHEPSPKPTNEKGEPNEGFFKSRHRELLDQYADAERRVKLYEYRVRDLQAQLTGNSSFVSNGKKGGGDAYAAMRVRQDLEHALTEQEMARADLSRAEQAIEDLLEEARRAGVEPGVFRQQ